MLKLDDLWLRVTVEQPICFTFIASYSGGFAEAACTEADDYVAANSRFKSTAAVRFDGAPPPLNLTPALLLL